MAVRPASLVPSGHHDLTQPLARQAGAVDRRECGGATPPRSLEHHQAAIGGDDVAGPESRIVGRIERRQAEGGLAVAGAIGNQALGVDKGRIKGREGVALWGGGASVYPAEKNL